MPEPHHSTRQPPTAEHMRELGRRGGQVRKVAAVERRIRDLVDNAPPLTEQQRNQLVLLLRGGAA